MGGNNAVPVGHSPCGEVYLVGAGPGDARLITLRGAECLSRADVVLYDYLVNARVLRHAPSGAERLCLGGHRAAASGPPSRRWSQQEINDYMVAEARAGRTVVRLKSGDPMVFGRAAEELEALTAAGLPFEIVPGISAAAAAAAYAGITVTDRDASSAVAFVTGQERPGKDETSLDYSALARFPGTLVFYMGVTTAGEWSGALMAAGLPAETPVAVVRRCTLPDQQIIETTLGQVARRLAEIKLRPPAVAIVGQVAHAEAAAGWFTARPLFGRRVLITRPAGGAEELVAAVAELGAEPLVQPAIEITEPPAWAPVDDALGRLQGFDWIVFSSGNGVRAFLSRLLERGLDLRALGPVKLAAIGPATARQLESFHLRVDVQPEEYRAEALADALCPAAAGSRFLLVRASRGREVLAEQLTAAGGEVEQIVVYTSRDTAQPDPEVARRLAAGEIDWVTVTSSAIARSLAALFGEDLRRARLASISPITSATLREVGHEPACEARQFTPAGVLAAIVEAEEERGFDRPV